MTGLGPDGLSSGCGLCRDFAELYPLGPCPQCRLDAYAEYVARLAATARRFADDHLLEGGPADVAA